jgi:tripartite-type tricarboxylate transporter receptor subunit TctC
MPRFIQIALRALVLFGLASAAQADTDKPIRIIVITAAGGSADFMARFIAERVGPQLGRNFIVDNRPGAGGNIATARAAQSPPDGNTLLLTSNNHTINPLIFASAGYDAARDFVPVVQLTRGPIVVTVGDGSSANTLADYVARARREPTAGGYATYGIGGAAHMVGEMLREASGSDLRHVPYRGAAPAITDAIGGQVPSAIVSLASATPHIGAGKLKALAIASAQRWPGSPDIPTLAELGYKDVVYDVWLGVLAPAGTDAAWVATLNREIAAAVTTPQARALLSRQGLEPVAGTAADFGRYLDEETGTMARLVKKNGITAD